MEVKIFNTEIIKKKMKRLGITQAELAKECGVSYQAINMLLNNKTLNKDLLEKVCERLELAVCIVDTNPVEAKEKPKKEERVQLID
jgi:transcriptional regulator with XRE-family HTH domain